MPAASRPAPSPPTCRFERSNRRPRGGPIAPPRCAGLASVTTRAREGRMESFFLAETLKYAWRLVAPPQTLDFGTVIFDTEAHPLKRTWDR